jgi:hypothetical protein
MNEIMAVKQQDVFFLGFKLDNKMRLKKEERKGRKKKN